MSFTVQIFSVSMIQLRKLEMFSVNAHNIEQGSTHSQRLWRKEIGSAVHIHSFFSQNA